MKYFAVLFMIVFSINPAAASPDWSRENIKYAQESLYELGYQPGPIDGLWGSKTKEALRSFYRDYDLKNPNFYVFRAHIHSVLHDQFSFLEEILDKEAAIRFENRIGFGAPEYRVARYVGKTRNQAIKIVVDELREYQDRYRQPSWVYEMKPVGLKDDYYFTILGDEPCDGSWLVRSLEHKWLNAAIQSPVPQFDRISTFWLDHFSVQFSAYFEPHAFAKHIDFIRSWRGKNLPELLKASLYDASNIVFLNNDKSHKNNPNENLAREFLELYSLGEGNYTEQDIRELAKLLTGLSYNANEEAFWSSPDLKYRGEVKILGRRINSLDQFISALTNSPLFGEFIVTKYYNTFISEKSPSEEFVKKLNRRFKASDFDLISLFEQTLKTEEFWSKQNELMLVKQPIDLYIGTARTLNSSGSLPFNSYFLDQLISAMNASNQDLFEPPSIEGWRNGMDWLEGQQVQLRSDRLYKLFKKEKFEPSNLDKANVRNAWRKINEFKAYEQGLRKFYSKAGADDLRIETLHFSFPQRAFAAKQYSNMEFILTGVDFRKSKLGDIQFWLQKRGQKASQMVFSKHLNPEGFLGSAKFTGNDHQLQLRLTLPLSSSQAYKNLNTTDRALVRRLFEATLAPLDHQNRAHYIKLTKPTETRAKKWLLNLHNHTKIEQISDLSDKKIFLYSIFDPNDWRLELDNAKYQKAMCDEKYYEYSNVVEQYFITLPQDDGRRYRVKADYARRANSPFRLSELLLPDINIDVDDEDYMSILASEAYNLK